jgi:hypothetical protein
MLPSLNHETFFPHLSEFIIRTATLLSDAFMSESLTSSLSKLQINNYKVYANHIYDIAL